MSKPVFQKLGIKEGDSVYLRNAPTTYSELVEAPKGYFSVKNSPESELGFIHLFVQFQTQLEENFAELKPLLGKKGMLWVSWPKTRSKLDRDINENIIRDTGLALGLVDVKVCSINDDWSALKFVYRLKDR